MTSWPGAFRRLCRRLLRTPLFTGVAVATLAVGIGANAAIFSVVYAVLLKPLPFSEPERLVGVWHRAPGLGLDAMNQSPSTYFTYRESNRVFEDVGMWDNGSASITGRGEPEQVDTLSVSDGTLALLRVQPQLGRLFVKEDDAPGAPPRIILTHSYWQRKFGGDPGIVGQTLDVNGRSREIVGVLRPEFSFLRTRPALLAPFNFDRAKAVVGDFSYQAIARLRPGVTLERANADVDRMVPIVLDTFPLWPGRTRKMFEDIRLSANVRPLDRDVIGDIGPMLWVLLGTVGVVLLIACANVANLFLVRAEGRQQELALRAALGASRARIARELLGESLMLGVAGGLFGLLFARAAIGLLLVLAPVQLPRLDEIGLNPIVLLFTLAISLLAGLLFGLMPVLRFGAPSVAALKEGGRSNSDGPTRHRARNVLVVSEIALALVLLVVSGLMVRTFLALRDVEPGFVRPAEVQTFRLSVPAAVVRDPEAVARLHQQLLERLRQVPGVDAAGLSSSITLDGNDSNDGVQIEDRPEPEGKVSALRRFKWIAPGYFQTMGRRFVAGRDVTWDDIYQMRPVVLLTENLARTYWKRPEDALGRRVRESSSSPWREIVGVVADERDDGLNKPARTIVYWPMLARDLWQQKVFVRRNMGYAVRSTRTGLPGFQQDLQQAVWSVNPNLPLANVQTLEELRGESMAQTSFALTMLALAAGVALLLGIVGIYGVIAYVAAQRTREIGIRMALGAEAADVRRLFLRHGLLLTAAGIGIGVATALALTRLMASLLFEVSAMDPLTYVAVSAVLATVALTATWLPARRAARVDPIAALRADV